MSGMELGQPSFMDFGPRPTRIKVAGRTHRGLIRTENQDTFLVVDLSTANEGGVLLEPALDGDLPLSGEFELSAKGALCVVADGMGGAAGGGVASTIAVASIHDELNRKWLADRGNSPQQFARCLKGALETGNRLVREAADTNDSHRGMGTTATAVGMLDGFLYIAQVGDSRAYMIRGGSASQITRDQSYTQHLVESGVMTPEEAEQSDQRNIILQALGSADSVDVEMTYQELRRGDIVVVCSDGLTKVVDRPEIAELAGIVSDAAALCRELVDLANDRGGPDNVTVVVVQFDGEGLEEPTAEDIVKRNVLALED